MKPETIKEIVTFFISEDERNDASIIGSVVSNDGTVVDGAEIYSVLSDMLVSQSTETIFGKFRDQIIDFFFQENGIYSSHAFLVEYKCLSEWPLIEIVSISPLDDTLLSILVSVAERYVESRDCVWK